MDNKLSSIFAYISTVEDLVDDKYQEIYNNCEENPISFYCHKLDILRNQVLPSLPMNYEYIKACEILKDYYKNSIWR